MVHEGDGPGRAAWAASPAGCPRCSAGQLAIAGLALMFLLAPDGRLLSPRWRYAAGVDRGSAARCAPRRSLSMDPDHVRPGRRSDEHRPGPQRAPLARASSLISVGLLASRGLDGAAAAPEPGRGAAAAAPDRPRRRRSSPPGCSGCSSRRSLNGGRQTWLAALPLFVVVPPAAGPVRDGGAAVPALRPRGDHQPDAGRSSAGTAFAALGYTTLVVVVGKLVDRQTSGFWLSLLATALVALAFQPLRRRVVRLANRVAYGAAGPALRGAGRLQPPAGPDALPATLLPAVAHAAGRAVSARAATATLTVPGVDAVTATWGWRGRRRHGLARGAGARRRAGTSAPSRCALPQRPRRCGRPTAACSRPWPTRRRSPSATRAGTASSPGTWRSSTWPRRELAESPAAAHRGGRRRPPHARGGHLAGRAAAPRRRSRSTSAVPARRSRRGAPAHGIDAAGRRAPTPRWSRCAS